MVILPVDRAAIASWNRSYSAGENIYRLKMEDLNGKVTYSDAVALIYTNGLTGNLLVYPNPTHGPLKLIIAKVNNTISSPGGPLTGGSIPIPATVTNNYSIRIVTTSGALVKTMTTTNPNWQTDVSTLMPGSYVIQVANQCDNKLVSLATFVKL